MRRDGRDGRDGRSVRLEAVALASVQVEWDRRVMDADRDGRIDTAKGKKEVEEETGKAQRLLVGGFRHKSSL